MTKRSYNRLNTTSEIPLYLPPIILGIITVIISWPLFTAGFVWYDDDIMFFNNPLFRSGFWDAVSTSFSFKGIVHYHPLVYISFALEKALFGTGAAALHITNIILHFFNSLLVYLLFKELRFSSFLSLSAAMIFVSHPMHVESFAWITERKDVLYTFFFLLSLIYYIRYCKNSVKRFYYFSLAAFLLSCLSKSMAVSLPLVLFLIDHSFKFSKKISYKDKLPYTALSAVFVILNLSTAFYFTEIHMYSLFDRISFVSYSVLFYPVKLIFPFKLSAIYPYPNEPGLIYYLSLPLLAAGLYLLYMYRKNKIIVFSSLFYLFTVMPVLPFIPFGISITADRFSYVPSLGVFSAVIFLVSHLNSWFQSASPEDKTAIFISNKKLQHASAAALLVLVSIYGIASFNRCRLWNDTDQLMNDVLEKDGNNYYAHFILGNYFSAKGLNSRAIESYLICTRLNRYSPLVYFNLGNIYLTIGNYRNAIDSYQTAAVIDPCDPLIYNNLGLAYENLKIYDSSMYYYKKSALLGYEPAKKVLIYYGISY